jgi:hypothetical protein
LREWHGQRLRTWFLSNCPVRRSIIAAQNTPIETKNPLAALLYTLNGWKNAKWNYNDGNSIDLGETSAGLGIGGVFAPMRRWMMAHGGQFSRSLLMLRLFLFLASMMALGANAAEAEDVPPCPDTVPIQIMLPGDKIRLSAAEIPASLARFRAFVDTVSKHIDARMVENKLCINRAKDRESMRDAGWDKRSLLQFVHWPLFMSNDYIVPAMASPQYSGPKCWISSPWIDLLVYRGEKHPSDRSDQQPIPQIIAIVYWNERQLLADQAMLSAAANVPLNRTMPLSPNELDHFIREYERNVSLHRTLPLSPGELGHFIREYERSELLGKVAAKPIEERVPPDLLWLLRRSRQGSPFTNAVHDAMDKVTEREGHTRLVLALIDRCFASPASGVYHRSIADLTDPILLDQYRIDLRPLR